MAKKINLTKEQIEDLLINVLDTPKMTGWKDNKIPLKQAPKTNT